MVIPRARRSTVSSGPRRSCISPHDPNVLYAGGNRLFRTLTEGQSWTAVSPDLTRHDPATLGISGGPITSDQTTAEYYATIFALAESPLDERRALDRIGRWTAASLARQRRDVERHHAEAVRRLHARLEHRAESLRARHGVRGCESVSARGHGAVHLEDHRFRQELVASRRRTSAHGVRSRGARGSGAQGAAVRGYGARRVGELRRWRHWKSLRRNLPIVPVHDLAIKDGDLIAATHGRGFWILDDISPLRQMTAQIGERARASLQAEGRVARDLGKSRGAGRGASGGHEPARRRAHLLLDRRAAPARDASTSSMRAIISIKSFSSAQDSLSRADSVHGDSVHHVEVDSARRVRNDSLAKAGKQPDTSKVVYGGEEAGTRRRGKAVAAARAAAAARAGQAGTQSLRVEPPVSRGAGVRRNDGHSHERANRARGPLLGAAARGKLGGLGELRAQGRSAREGHARRISRRSSRFSSRFAIR